MPNSLPNRNLLWASIVVDELARSGLIDVCIAPGSRSTPLTLAFAQHPDIEVYPHLDERSAAFFALGIAKRTGRPVALVCTSGSATANFFPAIIEAHESQVPLIILTGDRPPELRDSGANQTIDQVKMYGNYVLWSVDMALPEADPDPLLIRYLRTTAARAYATASGIHRGVVHLNMPFRKPLEPTLVETDKTELPPREDDRPFTSIPFTANTPTPSQVNDLVDIVSRYERGIVIFGPDQRGTPFSAYMLAQTCGYPVLADPLSDLRFDSRVATVGGYETFMNVAPPEPPDVVIRFSQVPTSKWLNDYLERSQPKHYVQISDSGVWSDDLHQTTEVFTTHSSKLCSAVNAKLTPRTGTKWQAQWDTLENVTWESIATELPAGDDFDGAFIYDLLDVLPNDTYVFAGNSLPIRHIDQFGKPSSKNIHIYGNRGASGIDGNISTGLGIAKVTTKPVVLLVGDITFYHDMNGLFAIKNLDLKNVTIVLMNNNGGGIFNRLPISGYDPAFTDLFIMPHGLQFEHAAKLYGLEFVSTDKRAEFKQLLGESIGSGVPRIIEVRTDIQHDEMRRKEVIKAVKSAVQAKMHTGESK